MNYQIVVNLTELEEKSSIPEINNVFRKKTNGYKLDSDEIELFNKVKCYTILIFISHQMNIEFYFLGKLFIISHLNEMHNILEKINLSIETLDSIKSDNNYVIPVLRGGLGNNLFQLITSYNYANLNNKKIVINPQMCQICHTKDDYLNSIFKKFSITTIVPKLIYGEKKRNYFTYFEIPEYKENVLFDGFFQNEKYLGSLINYFFDFVNIKRGIMLEKSMFIHFRLGDYVANKKFDAGLFGNDYYVNAFEKFVHLDINNIYVLSNDVALAKKLNPIQHKNIIYVELDELDSLVLMASCEYGGICANSSFSWWGAYINNKFNKEKTKEKVFIFPKIWFEGKTSKIYFNGSTIM